MIPLKNDTFPRALLKQPVEYTPVQMIRQAGHYLPKYKAIHAKADSFLDLCENTELATEATIQPLEHFKLGVAILFLDILTIPDAMGLGLYFAEGEGPKFTRPLQHERDIATLQVPDMDRLQCVFDAVVSICKALSGRVPLIGFSDGPFALACYMAEGGDGKEFHTVKTMTYSHPDLLHKILDVNAQAVTACLNAQIDVSAQAVRIFGTQGGVLSDTAFQEFSLHYMRQIVSGLRRENEGRRMPVIIFARGGGLWLEQMANIGAGALGLNWTCNIGETRRRVGDKVVLQDNFDPFTLFGTLESIETGAARILADFGNGSDHVFSLGHGISQHTSPEHAGILVDSVHELSRQYHHQRRNTARYR